MFFRFVCVYYVGIIYLYASRAHKRYTHERYIIKHLDIIT